MNKINLPNLSDKTVFIVLDEHSNREELAGVFQNIGCKAILEDAKEATLENLELATTADIILLDTKPSLPIIRQITKKLHQLMNELPPIFLVCDHFGSNLEDVYLEGIEAIFARPLRPEELLNSVASTYASLMKRDDRKYERSRIVRAKVTYSFGSIYAHGFVTNISSGGMFVGSLDQLPSIDDTIDFNMAFEGAQLSELSGSAVVRWIRPKIDCGRPPGFGIEFVDVDLEELSEFVNCAQ